MISVNNVTKKYNEFVAVNGISFGVKKGEMFAFLGPNGAGKTTTIKMLTTLLRPTDGEIELNRISVIKDPQKVRETFGIVFQDPSLDDELTAWENLEFHGVLYKVPKKLRRQRMEELLKFVELWDRRDNLVDTFSGGMKRRLEIARGLLHHPQIFFLDEPTLGLDPQTRNRIWEYLQKLNKEEKITIFFTTHYMDEAERFAQTIAIIDRGKIIAQGSSQELKKKTKKKTLEEAFIELTGREIREEKVTGVDKLRLRRRLWRGGRK